MRRTGRKTRKVAPRPGRAVHLDPAAVVRDDAVADREPEPGAPPRRLGGVERLEDLGLVRRAECPTPVSSHLDHDLVPRAPGSAAVRTVSVAALLHGVERVEHQRHQHLDQLLGVARRSRAASGASSRTTCEPLEALVVLEQEERLVHQRVERHRALGRAPWAG